jgi:hypothetical protein
MQRLRRGWRLAMVSLGVLRRDRTLGVFPVLGGLTALFAVAAFGLPAALLFSDDQNVLGVIVAAVGIYLSTFLTIFFGVALAGAAAVALDGRDATIGDGIAVARRHVGTIAAWAGVVTTVNIILRAIEERFGFVGAIVAGLLGAAWGIITFLVIPVIAIEGLGPIAALKRSASLFRQRWGEQIVGTASIGILVFLFGFLPAAILVGIGYLAGGTIGLVATIPVAAVILVVVAVIGQAAQGIFGVALYRYAVGEGAVAPFSVEDLAGSFQPKRTATQGF